MVWQYRVKVVGPGHLVSLGGKWGLVGKRVKAGSLDAWVPPTAVPSSPGDHHGLPGGGDGPGELWGSGEIPFLPLLSLFSKGL